MPREKRTPKAHKKATKIPTVSTTKAPAASNNGKDPLVIKVVKLVNERDALQIKLGHLESARALHQGRLNIIEQQLKKADAELN